MNLSIAAVLFLIHRAEPLQALELNLGVGALLQKAGAEGFGQDVFGGAVLEAAYAQKQGPIWVETGLSGIVGSGIGMNSGFSDDYIRGGGLHFDAGYSLVGLKYLDLKIGLGIGAKFVQLEHRENSMDQNFDMRPVSRAIRNRLVACGRGSLSIEIHGANGIGGVEIRPVKMELGPSYSAFTPSLAVYWPISD